MAQMDSKFIRKTYKIYNVMLALDAPLGVKPRSVWKQQTVDTLKILGIQVLETFEA